MEDKSGIINTDLKVKGPVSEQVFFNHIDTVTNNEFIKKVVTEYYARLKNIDEKNGKIISKDSFPQAKKMFTSGAVYDYDINKYLLKNKEKIGLADLFRFQFVNFVNEINFVDYITETANGEYDLFNKSIKIVKPNKNYFTNSNKEWAEDYINNKISLDEFNKEYVSENDEKTFFQEYLKKVIMHELTHVLIQRTLNGGNFEEEGLNTKRNSKEYVTTFSNGPTLCGNKIFRKYFRSGHTILSEITTDIFAKWDNYKILKINKNKYRTSPDHNLNVLIGYNDKKERRYGPYQYLAFFDQIFLKLLPITNRAEYILNQTNIQNILDSTTLYPNVDKKTTELILKIALPSNATKQEKISLEKDIKALTNCEKFLILLGYEYKSYYDPNFRPYGEFMQTAEAIVLNAYFEKFEKSKKTDKTFLEHEVDTATYLSRFIIKPNNKVVLPGYDNRTIMPSAVLSFHDMAKNDPENICLQIFDEYIKKLVKYTKQYHKELLTKNKFLAKEYESIKNESSLLLK